MVTKDELTEDAHEYHFNGGDSGGLSLDEFIQNRGREQSGIYIGDDGDFHTDD